MAFAAVLAVVHGSHEYTGSALCSGSASTLYWNIPLHHSYFGGWTFSPQALDLAISVYLVVFENSQLRLLALMLDLLWGGVHLLLALLSSTTET